MSMSETVTDGCEDVEVEVELMDGWGKGVRAALEVTGY